MTIHPWSKLALAQSLAITVALVFCFRAKLTIIFNTVLLVFLVGISSVGIGLNSFEREAANAALDKLQPSLLEFSPQKNVLHIVLDTLHPGLFINALEDDPSLQEKLDGFTFFPNTVSTYPTTDMSIQAMMTGKNVSQ